MVGTKEFERAVSYRRCKTSCRTGKMGQSYYLHLATINSFSSSSVTDLIKESLLTKIKMHMTRKLSLPYLNELLQ